MLPLPGAILEPPCETAHSLRLNSAIEAAFRLCGRVARVPRQDDRVKNTPPGVNAA